MGALKMKRLNGRETSKYFYLKFEVVFKRVLSRCKTKNAIVKSRKR